MIELIRIYFLSMWRNPLYDDLLAAKIINLIVFSFLFTISFIFGLFLDKIFMVIEPDFAAIDTFSFFFLYLFVADIILKFFVKSYKQADILPYLTLPISRKRIYILLFIKELFSKWNFIWVAILTPFFFKTIYPFNGLMSTFLLIFAIYCVNLTISFVMRYINILSLKKNYSFHILIPTLLTIGLGYTAYYVASATQLIIGINLLFSQYKIGVFFTLILLAYCLYAVFLKSCKWEIYSYIGKKEEFSVFFNFKWSKLYGINEEIIKLCIKEIVRSQLKRMILYVILFLIGGLYLFNVNEGHFLINCFITLLPILLLGRIYGEKTFNIESTFFDKLMVSPKNIPYLILKSKYILCVIHSAFNMIIFMIVFQTSILLWISTFFFGCGVFLFFIFQNVVYNNQRYDILIPTRNFSDFTFVSILLIVIITLSSGFILVTIEELTSERTTEWVMLITGIAGMLSSPFWLKNIYYRFLARKYNAMENFRNS